MEDLSELVTGMVQRIVMQHINKTYLTISELDEIDCEKCNKSLGAEKNGLNYI